MASLVFDKSNLVDLRSGINDLFDVFEHIADEFDTSKTTFHASPHASVMTKLEEVVRKVHSHELHSHVKLYNCLSDKYHYHNLFFCLFVFVLKKLK